MSRTERARRVSFFRRWSLRVGLLAAAAAVGGFALLPRISTGADYTVTHTLDDGSAGSLRAAIIAANAAGGGTPFEIDLALTPSDVITLGSHLDHINVDIVINGHGATVHGFHSHRIFFVETGNVTIKNFTLTEASATGGTGGDSGGDGGGGTGGAGGGGGGGGLGAGSAIFVGSTASVTVENVAFTNNAAQGGTGGTFEMPNGVARGGGGGGGGLHGDGGVGAMAGGGGGGGIFREGGAADFSAGGGGGGILVPGQPANGMTGGSGAEVLGVQVGGNGGGMSLPGENAPLMGGGGGGGGLGEHGGNGNVYGGGGGGGEAALGGTGGFGGGGGGAGDFSTAGMAGFGGGDGGSPSTGGNGGSGLGGAIFVMSGGSLTVVDSSFSGNTVAQGVGGAAINGGATGSIGDAQGEAIYVMAGTSLNFTVTSNGQISVSDTIAGGGEVQKLGMGELILTGVNTYTGATTVDAGRLAINGSVTSNVTVNNGGTLGGSGDITGNLLNDGIIAPGNSIGTLNVNGEFSLNPSSQLEIEINAAGQSDLITASGYTILDGTVNVKAAPGAYTNGQSYTFLIYTGNRSGGFSGIYDDLAFFDAVLQYGAQDVSFSLQQNANDFGDVARTFNQTSVATVFDNNTGSVLQPLADEMLYMTNEQVCHALDQLSGELYATNVQTQIQNTTNQMQMLAQHLRPALRVGGYESGVAAAPTLPSSELLVGFDRGGELVIRGQSDSAPRYTAWGNGYGLGGSARTDGNAAGLGYTLGGMQVGVERWLDEGSLAGLYGGYNYAQLNGRELTQRVQANSGQFGGYYRRDDGCDYYLVASGLSFDAYDSSRAIGIGAFNATAEANYDGWQSATYLERGRTHHVGATTLQPYAALQYIYLRQNSLSETGGGVANLDVAGVDAGSLRGSLGGRASREFTTQRGLVLVPQVRAAWLHEFLETNTLINNRFGALGGGSFAVQGLDMGRDWALLGTGLGWHLTEQLTLTGNYDAQANANQVFHVGSANVQYVW